MIFLAKNEKEKVMLLSQVVEERDFKGGWVKY
jgi:hypothetical protein